MSSLIAQFFRINVVLNMKATKEDTPQTVKGEKDNTPPGGVVGKLPKQETEGTSTITKKTVEEGVWNLPAGSPPPFVPMDKVSADDSKKEKKNSLLADFFQRTVTLNNNAKDESSPQSAYQENRYPDFIWDMWRSYDKSLYWGYSIPSELPDPNTYSNDTSYPKCSVSKSNGNFSIDFYWDAYQKCRVNIPESFVAMRSRSELIEMVIYEVSGKLSLSGVAISMVRKVIEQMFGNASGLGL